MEEYGWLLRMLCTYLNSCAGSGIPFLPESGDKGLPGTVAAGKDLPAGCVTALPEKVVRYGYVDGSCRMEMPFAVSLRVDGNSPAALTEVLDLFCLLTRALESFAPAAEGGTVFGRCRITDMPALTERADDGTAVYRACYVIEGRCGKTEAGQRKG